MNRLHRLKRVLLTLSFVVSALQAAPSVSFRPGEIWPDNKDTHINAYGGGILLHSGVYYWFGEHKIGGSAGNRAEVGVHVYSSRDLIDWKDEASPCPSPTIHPMSLLVVASSSGPKWFTTRRPDAS